MMPFYSDPLVTLHLGDCLDVMRELPDASVDSVVTDPPYGLGFMGKHWDHGVPGVDFWREMYRVLKPGGYLLSFAGTRTVHRFGVAIEDAGFEIRDTLMWIYASGFPKSLDVSKALDKVAGAERERVMVPTKPGNHPDQAGPIALGATGMTDTSKPVSDLARKWEGWGTALKPAHEPIVMARKPLVGTVAANVTRYGTGAINVDGCRIEGEPRTTHADGNRRTATRGPTMREGLAPHADPWPAPSGRWPSNVLLSDPELFDEPNPWVVGSGAVTTVPGTYKRNVRPDHFDDSSYSLPVPEYVNAYGDSGGYSRFFLIPKADRAERERGLAGRDKGFAPTMNDGIGGREHSPDDPRSYRANVHPTVKPIDLMRHLVRLVTPPGGVVLDPFLGSGTTALAASEEGFRCIGIEREAEYLEIAKGRLMATPMGLGLDVPAPTRRDIGKQRGNRDSDGHPTLKTKRRAPSENYTGGWAGTNEEDAA